MMLLQRMALCLLVVATTLAPTGPTWADTPDEQFELATGIFQRQSWELAADKLREFLQANPRHPKAKFAAYQLGAALYRAHDKNGDIDFAAAAAAYQNALNNYPDPKLAPPANFELGDAYFNLKQYEKAIAAHSEFLKSAPPADKSAQARYWIGESYYALGKSEPARAAYAQVVADYPKSDVAPFAQYSLGLIAADTGRHADAAAAFAAVIERFPNSEVVGESRLRLADALLAQNRFDAARDRYQALVADPGAAQWKSEAMVGLADAQFGLKDWPAAAASYSNAQAALKPDDSRQKTLRQRQGDAWFNAKDYDKAIAAYTPLADSADAKAAPAALYWLASSLRARQRYADAATRYNQLLTRYPKDPLASKAALHLGDAYADAHDTAHAVAAYKTVIAQYADSDAAREATKALVDLAGAVAGSGAANDPGRTELEHALESLPAGPESSDAQLRLAQAAFAREDWSKAIDLAQASLKGKPAPAVAENALYLIGSAKLRAHDAGAAAAFRQQVAAYPAGKFAVEGNLGLSWALLDAKNWSGAEAAARAGLAAGAKGELLARTQLALGEALLRAGKPADASSVFSQVTADGAMKENALQGGAVAAEGAKQWNDAATRWGQLAALTKDMPLRALAFRRQGTALVQAKNPQAAQAAFDSALAADPKGETGARALYESAWVAHDLKSDEAARWAKLGTDFPTSTYAAEALFQQGEAQYAAKAYAPAAAAYRTLTERFPTHKLAPAAWYQQGSALYQAGSYAEAQAAFDKAAATRSEYAVEASYWAADSARRAGQLPAARSRYETFIQAAVAADATTDDGKRIQALLPQARLGLGQALAAAGETGRAAELYRAGLNGARGTTAAELNYRLGETLMQEKNWKEAAAQFLKVVISFAGSEWAPRAQWQAAQALEQSGDTTAAIKEYKDMAAAQPATEVTAKAQERLKALGQS